MSIQTETQERATSHKQRGVALFRHPSRFRTGGRSFPVSLEYDEQLKESYPAYPDFEKHPEYTGDVRPFATAEQESCPYRKPNALQGSRRPATAAAAAGFTGRILHTNPSGSRMQTESCSCIFRRTRP